LELAKHALSMDSTQVITWHLLALLMSAQKSYESALSLCKMAIRNSEWEVRDDGTGEKQGTPAEGEQVLHVLMTRVMLEHALYGASTALKSHSALFALYGRVFTGDGIGSVMMERVGEMLNRNTSTKSVPLQAASVGTKSVARSTVTRSTMNTSGPSIRLGKLPCTV
jgi:hypothetical protein